MVRSDWVDVDWESASLQFEPPVRSLLVEVR
jgi:hypothetical protein